MNMARSIGIRSFLLAAVVSLLGTMAGCGGGGTPAPPPPTTQQNSIVAGDFDRDGRLDLAVTTAFFSGALSLTGEVELFFQDPFNPGFFSLPVVFPVGNNPAQIAVADLNGDLHPDLVVANTDSDTVSVLFNSPFGNFLPAVDFATGPAPLSVAIGDLDRDGLPDIAVAVADGVDILFQNPAVRGTFFAPEFQALTGGAFSVAIGDLDGDLITDLAAAGTDAVFVFFQDPDPLFSGTFSLPAGFTAGINPNGVAVADIDRDGLLDIAVANSGSTVDGSGASISVLIQDPLVAGNFLRGDFPAPAGAQNLAVGDLNGDGFPDIAVPSVVFTSANAGVISVFLQDRLAPGNFVLTESHLDGFTPLSVAIGDLDFDGRPDIAVQDGPSILFQDRAFPGTFFDEVLI